MQHDFIAKEQARYLKERRDSLDLGEFIIVGDFAENYSFVLQDAVQSFHWNNLQATLHPFVGYYKVITDGTTTLKHFSFVVISESNTHDTVAVHLFQRLLMTFIRENIAQPTHIIYFSDGCAAQYKNRKNFVNLCQHVTDFGVSAEWHFFATSHGKGPCDGVGGTVKRLAAKASLQRPYDKQIMTPRQLYEFGRSELKAISFCYATIEEHESEAHFLKDRFVTARTIAGTHGLHSFRPVSREKLEVRAFSSSPTMREEQVSLYTEVNVPFPTIRGYVTAIYDGHWWLACVLKMIPDSGY